MAVNLTACAAMDSSSPVQDNKMSLTLSKKDKEWFDENCTFSVKSEESDKKGLLAKIIVWIATTIVHCLFILAWIVLTIFLQVFCCCFCVEREELVHSLLGLLLLCPPIISALFYLFIDNDDVRSIEAVAPLIGFIFFYDPIILSYQSIINMCKEYKANPNTFKQVQCLKECLDKFVLEPRKTAEELESLNFIAEYAQDREKFKKTMQYVIIQNGNKSSSSEDIDLTKQDKKDDNKDKLTYVLVVFFALMFAVIPILHRIYEMSMNENDEQLKHGSCGGYCIFTIISGLFINFY